jgi:hypothetical protein
MKKICEKDMMCALMIIAAGICGFILGATAGRCI